MTESSAVEEETAKNGRFFVTKIEDAHHTDQKSCETGTLPMTECIFRAWRGKAGRRRRRT